MTHDNVPAHRRSFAWLLALPPLMAVLGGAITLYIVIRYPDQAIVVEDTVVHDDQGNVHRHVVNSVTPPLK